MGDLYEVEKDGTISKVKGIIVGTKGIVSEGKSYHRKDIEIEKAEKGLILIDLENRKWLVNVSTTGTLTTIKITASQEISEEERKAKKEEIEKIIKKAKRDIAQGKDLSIRVSNIEKILGLR